MSGGNTETKMMSTVVILIIASNPIAPGKKKLWKRKAVNEITWEALYYPITIFPNTFESSLFDVWFN